MEENKEYKCSGNCLNCMPAQRAYCASQHAYSNMKVLDTMMGYVLEMKDAVDDLKAKIEAIQNSEALLFDPTEECAEAHPHTEQDIAQYGDGATVEAPI